MEQQNMPAPFSFEGRLSRSKSRHARDQVAQARVTQDEHGELLAAAKRDGRALGEWVREILLREARADRDMLFTELIATRMLLLNLLKPLALGEKVTTKDVADISAQVRKEKRRVAQEVRQQYAATPEKEQ